MTEKQIEAAAREFCRLRGFDPDASEYVADERHPTLAVMKPRWQIIVPHVRDHMAMRAAIEAVKSDD